MWQQSEKETAELRETVDVPPEAAVYRNGDLMALVYREANPCGPQRWHLYVACAGGDRTPEMEDVLGAREELLPDILDFAVTPEPTLKNTVHVWELIDPQGMRARLPGRLS